jgi:hypothetical protein
MLRKRRGQGSWPARAISFMNVAHRLVVGSVRRGTTASPPSEAWSKRVCRIGRSSGVIGTMRTAWPLWAALFGLRTVIRLRSQLRSPQRSSTISEGQRRPVKRLRAMSLPIVLRKLKPSATVLAAP